MDRLPSSMLLSNPWKIKFFKIDLAYKGAALKIGGAAAPSASLLPSVPVYI